MKVRIPARSLRDPLSSGETYLGIEENVMDCDGSICNRWADGEFLPVHDHLFLIGARPDAGPRCFAFRWPFPEEVYEGGSGQDEE